MLLGIVNDLRICILERSYIQQEGSVDHSIRLINLLHRGATLFVVHTHYELLVVGVDEKIVALLSDMDGAYSFRVSIFFELVGVLVQLICIYTAILIIRKGQGPDVYSLYIRSLPTFNSVRACHFEIFPPFALNYSIIDIG